MRRRFAVAANGYGWCRAHCPRAPDRSRRSGVRKPEVSCYELTPGRSPSHGIFELEEGELCLGLGPVAGDYLGNGPVVVIGDEHVLAEQFFFQAGAGGLVDTSGEPQVA